MTLNAQVISRVILVHGFNVSDDGANTTGKLANLFYKRLGVRVIEFTPGWRGLLGVRFGNKRRAQNLANLIQPGDLLIGHSDGCNLIDKSCHELSSLGSEAVDCVYFNAALDRDTALSKIVRKCLVFHTKSDTTVWLSKWLALHPWGEMGRKGYKAQHPSQHDDRYINVSYESMGHHDLEHSSIFKRVAALDDAFTRIRIEFDHIPKAVVVDDV